MSRSHVRSNDDTLLALVGLGTLLLGELERTKRHLNRKCWTKPMNSTLERNRYGISHSLLQELEDADEKEFTNFTRLNKSEFHTVLQKVTPLIAKQDTVMRSALTPYEKLATTLRFLATGETYTSLHFTSRIARSTIGAFIPEVCDAIYDTLQGDFLRMPENKQEWLLHADNFDKMWQFPHCLGAIDGKHIEIRRPSDSACDHRNYKDYESIVLMAVVDATGKFICYDLGSPGSSADGGIFKDSGMCDIQQNFPDASPLSSPNRTLSIPYFLVGDDAFALSNHLMKPYPHRTAIGDQKVFNYRLSRARRTVECAFGVLVARFRILLGSIQLDTDNVNRVVRACIALHNFLGKDADLGVSQSGCLRYAEHNAQLTATGDIGDSTTVPNVDAREVRDELSDFFFDEGALPFQWSLIE